MIQVFNLFKSYGGISPALNDISFTINQGDFVFLTGPSGAGKTTLLKILFSWERFEKGQVLVNRINVGKLEEKKFYTLRRRIGVVFQDYKLLARKTVFENISFAQEVVGADHKTIKFRTWEALKNVGMTHKKDYYPRQLSGGEQQRAAIARALVNSPEIVLADEPTGNLDPEISLKILKLFEKVQMSGTTVIFATHSLEMLKAGNHPIFMLNRGRLVGN